MKVLSYWISLPVTCAFFFCSGCDKSDENPYDKPEIVEEDQTPPTEWGKYRKNTDWHDSRKIVSPVLRAVFDKDYAKLEKLAAGYRDNRTRRQSGGFALYSFYSAFGNYSGWNQRDAKKYYPVLLERIREWRKAYPDSPTPHVALAAYYTGYAWHARGGGWAKTVSKEGWKLFKERLGKAVAVLEESKEVASKDPHYYHVALVLSKGVAFEWEEVLNIFGDSLDRHPAYWGNYYQTCLYLLPRWHGNDHTQWHTFLVEALESVQLKQEEKDEIYTLVCLGMIDAGYSDEDEPNAFDVCRVDWSRLKKGAGTVIRKYPEATAFPSEYLKAAVAANQLTEAKRILISMKFRYDAAEWSGKNDREFFDLVQFLDNIRIPRQ